MSSTTTNLGLVKMASGETIGQWSDANNGSGGNLDKIDTAVGNLNSHIANLIVEVSTPEAIAPNSSATIAYPTGFTIQNTRVVYSMLYLSASNDRYPSAVEVQTISSDGVHAKNVGGASGRIVIGIVKM